jgi:aminopeptidase N
MKTCRACGIEKALDGFSTNGKSGHHPVCKVCRSAQSREQRIKHGDHIRALEAEKYQRNKDAMRAANKAYCDKTKAHRSEIERARYQENAEQIKSRAKQYRETNPEKVRAWNGTRRAAQRKALPSWADKRSIAAIYAEALRMSRATGIKHHVDHMIPLSHPLVCGLHVPGNLQILTQAENLKKSNAWN